MTGEKRCHLLIQFTHNTEDLICISVLQKAAFIFHKVRTCDVVFLLSVI